MEEGGGEFDDLFRSARVFVEATEFEMECLKHYWDTSPFALMTWKYCRGVGYQAKTTHVHIRYATINGHVVGFVEPTGTIVNWAEVTDFIKMNTDVQYCKASKFGALVVSGFFK